MQIQIQVKWDPKVMRICFFMWTAMGNKNFDRLRSLLMLPHKRSLQRFGKNMPNGNGIRSEMFVALKKLFDEQAKDTCDYDVNVIWDATGYAKTVKFDKHSGKLKGFDDGQSDFSKDKSFANKVNCFTVTSPQEHIDIKFPVAYYHKSTLTAADIRQQLEEVMQQLDAVGLRVVSLICDGASEHRRFFDTVLEEVADDDDDCLVRIGDAWVISDPPHLLKKFRNNFLQSGCVPRRHTRWMCKDGFHIGWDIMEAVYIVATTTSDGKERFPRSLHKLIWDAVSPSSIQKLRVSLAAIIFCVEKCDRS